VKAVLHHRTGIPGNPYLAVDLCKQADTIVVTGEIATVKKANGDAVAAARLAEGDYITFESEAAQA